MTKPPNKFSSNEILHRTRTKLTHTAKQAQNYDYETLFDRKKFIEKLARLLKDQIVDKSAWVSSTATHTKSFCNSTTLAFLINDSEGAS